MARKVVGLDIGTTAVRAAEVSVRRGQVVLERVGQAGLPDGAVVDGEVSDPAAVATAIKDLWRRTRISSRRVIIGVANQRVVVRLVDLPWMQPAELRGSLAFQAGDYLPIPVDQTELDYAVIGEHEAAGGQRLLRVLLVAAQKEMLAGHLDAVRAAGLRPAGIDLNPIALLRSLGPVAGFEEGAEALVDVGARVTNLVVHDNGVLRFVRILLMGGEDVTSTLERVLALDRETADPGQRRLQRLARHPRRGQRRRVPLQRHQPGQRGDHPGGLDRPGPGGPADHPGEHAPARLPRLPVPDRLRVAGPAERLLQRPGHRHLPLQRVLVAGPLDQLLRAHQLRHGDTINGPLHTNDTISVNGNPRFNGKATTAYTGTMSCAASPSYTWRWYGLSGCSDRPVFQSGDPEAVPILTLPTTNTAIKTETDRAAGTTGCLYNGPTRIVLNASGTMTVTSPFTTSAAYAGCVGTNVALPANGRRHRLRLPRRRRVPVRHPAGRLTIAAENNIVIDGNTTYQTTGAASTDMLGLVANQFVQVYHPVNSSGTNLASFTNPQIHAAMLALGHSFIVQNYDEGAQLGTITINGVIAQKWRGPVGTSGGTGYLKNYGYDSRLQYASPPYVQDITETPYRVSQWAEIQNPSGLPA